MKPEKEIVSGTVEEIIYHNTQNDYTVLELTGDDGSMITAVGALPFVAEGEELVLYGSWTTHPTYGQQFAVDTFEKRLPADVHAILRYLSSRAVKGVGPSTAAKIVARYGADTFEVIENHPDWLSDIPGISPKKAAAISEAFREQTGVRSVMMFCRDFFSVSVATRVYKRFGPGAVGMIKDNPYCLADPAFGIGFLRADEIAATLGIGRQAPVRILSGLEYVLSYNAATNGHSCLPKDKLIAATATQLGIGEETVTAVLAEAVLNERLDLYEKSKKEAYVFLPDHARAEAYLAARLPLLDRHSPTYSRADAEALIARVEKEQGIRYAAHQREAIYRALGGGVLILTGGPGTGKTTVVMALLRIFRHLGHRVALAAPPGRAAKRMSEASGEEARTIHRLLETERVSEGEPPRFNRNERNPLDEDVLIIDEASMLDLPLCEALVRAVRHGTRLIFIGDVDQLPSVGTGNILGDLIASGVFTTVCLTEVFRQSEKSLIVTNAHAVNRGELPVLTEKDSDFFFLSRTEGQIAPTVTDLLSRRLPHAYGEEIGEKIQIITPSRKGRAGTEPLNRLLQEALNPHAEGRTELSFRDRIFREGDRVMQTRNNYDIEWEKDGITGLGIFNGDIGVITEIDRREERMFVRFDDRVAIYDFSVLEELEHAYAITVHKSQGSEYPVVIVPLYAAPPPLLTRNLLYTAITRAKEMVILVGREEILSRMVENNHHEMRYTCLAFRMEKEARA